MRLSQSAFQCTFPVLQPSLLHIVHYCLPLGQTSVNLEYFLLCKKFIRHIVIIVVETGLNLVIIAAVTQKQILIL